MACCVVMVFGVPAGLTISLNTRNQGGALSYKPKGKPKGAAFGNDVRETETLLDPKYESGKVFRGITLDPNNATARAIAALPDHTIRQITEHYLGPDEGYGPRRLADKLIARRDDLAKQYGLAPEGYAEGGAVSEKITKADASYRPSGDQHVICVLCSMWQGDHQCSLVTGHIDRTGTCSYFERRKPKS